jgi:hypothetical protein
MFRRYLYCFISIICLVFVLAGIIRINTNFYKLICKDNNKSKVAEVINEDNAFIKIFGDTDEGSELYTLLDNSKNQSIMVFYKSSPLDLNIEGNRYCLYFNETIMEKYKSSINNMYAAIKYEYSSIINNVKDSILKITSKISSY